MEDEAFEHWMDYRMMMRRMGGSERGVSHSRAWYGVKLAREGTSCGGLTLVQVHVAKVQ